MKSIEELLAHPDAIWLLQERLTATRGASSDRLAAHLALARLCRAGGDEDAVTRHLDAAHSMATSLGDVETLNAVRAEKARRALISGLAAPDDVLLHEALEVAVEADDTLSIVALSCAMAAVCMEHSRWQQARMLGAQQVAAASRRGNWLGVVDGLITQATCVMRLEEDLQGAIGLLLHGGKHLNEVGAAAAVNLIKARLGEIRGEVGAAAFDDALKDVLAQLNAAG